MNSANSSLGGNSSAITFGGGDYSSLSTLSEDFPADLIHELEAATAANGNDDDQMIACATEGAGG